MTGDDEAVHEGSGWKPDRSGLRCPYCTWLLETWTGLSIPPRPVDQTALIEGRMMRCPNGHGLTNLTAPSREQARR